MSAITNKIRRTLKGTATISGFWVRQYRDGSIWVGPCAHSERDMQSLRAALVAAGYQTEYTGTSGEFIIEVKLCHKSPKDMR